MSRHPDFEICLQLHRVCGTATQAVATLPSAFAREAAAAEPMHQKCYGIEMHQLWVLLGQARTQRFQQSLAAVGHGDARTVPIAIDLKCRVAIQCRAAVFVDVSDQFAEEIEGSTGDALAPLALRKCAHERTLQCSWD